jgi:DNA-binding beta-propeller fold protein YncE
MGVALAADGSLYVTDAGNQTIRKITSDGRVSTLAGTAGLRGAADGIGAAARFRFPTGVAVDAKGQLYVADFLNFAIRKINLLGEVTTLAGAELHAGHADGLGQEARFEGPVGLAVDAQGTLYVADGTTIRLIK